MAVEMERSGPFEENWPAGCIKRLTGPERQATTLQGAGWGARCWPCSVGSTTGRAGVVWPQSCVLLKGDPTRSTWEFWRKSQELMTDCRTGDQERIAQAFPSCATWWTVVTLKLESLEEVVSENDTNVHFLACCI